MLYFLPKFAHVRARHEDECPRGRWFMLREELNSELI